MPSARREPAGGTRGEPSPAASQTGHAKNGKSLGLERSRSFTVFSVNFEGVRLSRPRLHSTKETRTRRPRVSPAAAGPPIDELVALLDVRRRGAAVVAAPQPHLPRALAPPPLDGL